MPKKCVRLVVGLGNPGNTYKKTRHNVGFMVVDQIAEDFSIALVKQKFDTIFGRGVVDGVEVVLAKPMAFMNRSGPQVQKIARYYRILSEDMLVVHDDIDLAFGRIKIKEKGGDGGHKGVRSIIDAIGGGDFVRLRIGVGRPEASISAADYVLGKFSSKEKKVLHRIITEARDAVGTILCKGAKEGMNRFNDKRILISS
ncbi:MAG: aminoacyl-tRNA hydrolase [Deltaproteobacteria bacterium]|nr:MAG: aminoacyl-tRNA hydrolase [Deltaproteobacteria bacterium]